jgi:XTP/dITP diphosphohydrolase
MEAFILDLLVGTHNPGKRREYQELLAGLPVRWLSPQEAGLGSFEPEETGDTFEANARLKALAYAQAAGMPALADDSGLEVDALDGAPGIYSARYGDPDATDADRYVKLLEAMEAIPEDRRVARFVCVVALALPDGRVYTSRGTMEGQIGYAPKGANGFGYDPVFVLPDGRHLAELSSDEKHTISHRGTALAAFKPTLLRVLV